MESRPVPRVIAWESTRACRFACVHCRADAQTEPDPKQLKTEEAYQMVNQISEFSNPVFIISGGDPLLRKDIFDIAALASRKGLKVVMSPSGSRIQHETVNKMQESGIQAVSISLDGSNPDVHDGFRRVNGSFETATDTLNVLREEGMPFQINTTVTQHNLEDLPNIRDMAVKLGASTWDVFMLVPTGRAKVKMEIEPVKYEETLARVYEWNQATPIPIKMTCAPHYMRIITQSEQRRGMRPSVDVGDHTHGRSTSGRFGGRGCMAGNGFCFISHTGKVYGCGFLPLEAGDIRRQHFREIYQGSPLFRSLRNYDLLEGRCSGCEYRRICGGCRARALGASDNLFGEEPYCTYRT
jgi:radical SAM protein